MMENKREIAGLACIPIPTKYSLSLFLSLSRASSASREQREKEIERIRPLWQYGHRYKPKCSQEGGRGDEKQTTLGLLYDANLCAPVASRVSKVQQCFNFSSWFLFVFSLFSFLFFVCKKHRHFVERK